MWRKQETFEQMHNKSINSKYSDILAESKQWADCSEIIIYPVEPQQKKRCFSTITDHMGNACTTFASHKNTENIGVCKRIIVNAANKEIRIFINALMQIQIVGSKWEAFLK